LIKAFKPAAIPRIIENTSIVKAKLGNQAGMVGAAWLISRETVKPTIDIDYFSNDC